MAASVASRECDLLFFLHADYGQLTQAKELECFHALCGHFGAAGRLVADLSYFAQIGGSSLTDPSVEMEPADPDREVAPSSYVPFRNAHLLAVGASWAEVLGAGRLYFGAVAEDGSGYPDCRPEFYRAFQELVALGTRPETNIRVVTPVIGMRKVEVVLSGVEMGTPFELTWSCYRFGDAACGVCDSCVLRLRGFLEAGVDDPIPYKSRAGVRRQNR